VVRDSSAIPTAMVAMPALTTGFVPRKRTRTLDSGATTKMTRATGPTRIPAAKGL